MKAIAHDKQAPAIRLPEKLYTELRKASGKTSIAPEKMVSDAVENHLSSLWRLEQIKKTLEDVETGKIDLASPDEVNQLFCKWEKRLKA